MKKYIAALAILSALAAPALAQQINLPPNTVYGRLGTGAGPGQAIPFATLAGQMSTVPGGAGNFSTLSASSSLALSFVSNFNVLSSGAGVVAGVAPNAAGNFALVSNGTGANPTFRLLPNSGLANSDTAVNGQTCTLGSSCTVTAAAGTLTGTTLASTIVSSSLAGVGTITSGIWNAGAVTSSGAASFAGTSTLTGAVGVGTAPFASYKFTVRTGTDQNLAIFGPQALADGISISSVNNSNSAVGMEFAATAFRFTYGDVTLVRAPSSTLHAATKGYVDTADALLLPLAGGTMTGAIVLAADPTTALQPATKQYADAIGSAVQPKVSVTFATTANITLSGEQTIDTVVTSASRGLVWKQTAPAENGIYTTGAGAWTRVTDLDVWSEAVGAQTFVTGGSANIGKQFTAIVAAGGTIGVTSMPWSQTGATTVYLAGTGITLTGSTFSLTAPVTPALGGSGTTTVFTAGSVVFAGASGVYGQDNANLFWDDSNNRLGLGTAAPAAQLHTTGTVRFASLNAAGAVQTDASGNLSTSSLASTLVTTIAAGTGATSITQSVKNRQVRNVMDYGAACDGSTDDATAFSNAIAAAVPNTSNGFILMLPPGVCVVSNITLNKAGMILQGQGHNSTSTGTAGTEIKGNSAANDVIDITAGGVQVRDLMVSSSVAVGSRTGAGIKVANTGTIQVEIDKVLSIGHKYGFWVQGAGNTINGAVAQSNNAHGVFLDGSAGGVDGTTIYNTQANGNTGDGYRISGTSIGITLINPGSAQNTGNGLTVTGNISDLYVVNPVFSTNANSIDTSGNTGQTLQVNGGFLEINTAAGVVIGANQEFVTIGNAVIAGATTVGLDINGTTVAVSGTAFGGNGAANVRLGATSARVTLGQLVGSNAAGSDPVGLVVIPGAGAFMASGVNFSNSATPLSGAIPAGSCIAASPNLGTYLCGAATGVTLALSDTTDATSSTAASGKTAGGFAVAKKLWVGGVGLASTAVQNWDIFAGVTAQLRAGSDAFPDFGTTSNHPLYLMTNGVRRVQVATNGDMTVSGSGTTCVIGSGTGATNCTSDARLKTPLRPIADVAGKLAQIRGGLFNWLDPTRSGPEHIGVIAQDVERAFPQCVGETGGYKTVDMGCLVAPLISVVNDLRAMNDNLRAANDNLSNRVYSIEANMR